MKPRFSGIPFFVYPVSDMARARRVYGGVLGLQEGAAWGEAWVEYRVGRQTLALSTMMKGSRPGAPGGALALETADFTGAVAHLKRRRVKFLFGPQEMPTGACARGPEPAGNPWVFNRKPCAGPEGRPERVGHGPHRGRSSRNESALVPAGDPGKNRLPKAGPG